MIIADDTTPVQSLQILCFSSVFFFFFLVLSAAENVLPAQPLEKVKSQVGHGFPANDELS